MSTAAEQCLELDEAVPLQRSRIEAEFDSEGMVLDITRDALTLVLPSKTPEPFDNTEDQPFFLRWIPEPGTVACHFVDPELFDPKSQEQFRQAKSVCGQCSIEMRAKCREMAEYNWETGVYDGNFYRDGEIVESPRFSAH